MKFHENSIDYRETLIIASLYDSSSQFFLSRTLGLCYCLSFVFSRPANSVVAIICFGILNIVIALSAVSFILASSCPGVYVGVWLKRTLSIFPQFALLSAFFTLALKEDIALRIHECVVCPIKLFDEFVPGAEPGTRGYHPQLRLSCRSCNDQVNVSCYNDTAPVPSMSETAAWSEVRQLFQQVYIQIRPVSCQSFARFFSPNQPVRCAA